MLCKNVAKVWINNAMKVVQNSVVVDFFAYKYTLCNPWAFYIACQISGVATHKWYHSFLIIHGQI